MTMKIRCGRELVYQVEALARQVETAMRQRPGDYGKHTVWTVQAERLRYLLDELAGEQEWMPVALAGDYVRALKLERFKYDDELDRAGDV